MTEWGDYIGEDGKICFVKTAPDGQVTNIGFTSPGGASARWQRNPDLVPLLAAEAARLDGTCNWRIVDGALVPAPAPDPLLSTLRASAENRVDSDAETARLRWLTPGAGQSLEYEASAADAQRARDAADPLDPADYPWLAAEQAAQAAVGRERTIREIAEATLDARAAWNNAGAQIKAIRREAKLRLAQATDATEIDAIVGAVTWPTP